MCKSSNPISCPWLWNECVHVRINNNPDFLSLLHTHTHPHIPIHAILIYIMTMLIITDAKQWARMLAVMRQMGVTEIEGAWELFVASTTLALVSTSVAITAHIVPICQFSTSTLIARTVGITGIPMYPAAQSHTNPILGNLARPSIKTQITGAIIDHAWSHRVRP